MYLLILATCRGNDPLVFCVTGRRLHHADSQAFRVVPPPGIEPSIDAYKATVIPVNYRGKLVCVVGFEPTLT